MVSLWRLPNMEYVIGCVRIYACACLLLNVLRVDRHVVSGVARLVLSIHDRDNSHSCPLGYMEDDVELLVLPPNSLLFEQSDPSGLENADLRKRAR